MTFVVVALGLNSCAKYPKWLSSSQQHIASFLDRSTEKLYSLLEGQAGEELPPIEGPAAEQFGAFRTRLEGRIAWDVNCHSKKDLFQSIQRLNSRVKSY